MNIEWTETSKERPPYGLPLLICYRSTPQHITYTLNGADEDDECDENDWFGPYDFEDEYDELKIPWNEVGKWWLIPDTA